MKRETPGGQERVTVSLSPGRLRHVRASVARGEASSVSAFVDQVLAEKEQSVGLLRLLDDLDREYGAPTAADIRWARRVLGT
ncbi:MAG: hypothetical protein NVSMB17_14430 [Candidatus Dormibacteria bacterium]